jgi:hypothetical protein
VVYQRVREGSWSVFILLIWISSFADEQIDHFED